MPNFRKDIIIKKKKFRQKVKMPIEATNKCDIILGIVNRLTRSLAAIVKRLCTQEHFEQTCISLFISRRIPLTDDSTRIAPFGE